MYYTYMWLREDGTPYYVGKGKGKRAYVSFGHSVLRPKDDARIIIQYWASEEEAFSMEKWWIALFGRKDNGTGILRNHTDGGENPPNHKGKKRTKEHRQKIAEALKGNKNSLGKKLKITEARRRHHLEMKGKPRSEETRKRMGGPRSEESRKNMSIAKLGSSWSAIRRAAYEANWGNNDIP